MKKFLAILLALVMVLGMVACGGGSDDADTGAADTGSESTGSEDAGSTDEGYTGAGIGEVEGEIHNEYGLEGMYDPDKDYNANPTYKVCYYVLATGVLYEAMGEAIAHWCSIANMEYGGLIDYAGDKDAYLSNLVTIAQEYDGVVLDPDAEQYNRCAEILNEAGTPWMGVMAEARDYSAEGAPLLHPYVGFDNYEVGVIDAQYLIEYYQREWPDVDPSEIAWACVDFSLSPPLATRQVGFYDTLIAHDPTIADRYFIADTAGGTGNFDLDNSASLMAAVVSANPQYEYWCVFGETDTQAQGAAVCFDNAGLTDTAAVVTFGGTGLQQQWDSGMQDSWVAACYLPQTIYCEPILFALYSFMEGTNTPEEIWNDWEPINEDTTYAMRGLPAFWIEYETYKHMIKWSDIYAGSNYFADYPDTFNGQPITRDDFSAVVPYKPTVKGYTGE